VTVVTTLLDARAHPAESIAALYGLRWRVEQHWRELKVTLGMRQLKCKSVAGVLKELAAYLLAYNLVRGVMLRARRRGRGPRRTASASPMRCAGCCGPRPASRFTTW
jgi:IS4 transposase